MSHAQCIFTSCTKVLTAPEVHAATSRKGRFCKIVSRMIHERFAPRHSPALEVKTLVVEMTRQPFFKLALN